MIFVELKALGLRGLELRKAMEKGEPNDVVALLAEYEALHQKMDEEVARLRELLPHLFWRDDDPEYIEIVMQWRRERVLRKRQKP